MNVCVRNSKKLSICFVSLDNYATLVDDPQFGHIGGAERQQAIIGRELAKRGYRVSFITLDHGQDDMERDGMRIFKAYRSDAGIRVLRFVHPRLTSLWRAMKRADADIYYQRTRDSTTGLVAAICRWHHWKFVFAAASDHDCMADLQDTLARHERIFYHCGLHRANLVIAQTLRQQRLLRENFGIDSTVIPNCIPDTIRSSGCVNGGAAVQNKRLLWIGRFTPVKQLELLLDVAERNPDLQFDVVGDGNRETKYVQRLLSRADSISNVHLHGVVSHTGVDKFYQHSRILISTSLAEGFPNVFLEAWSHGLPVVSAFDPDNLIAKHGLGVTAANVTGLTDGIQRLLNSNHNWLRASRAALKYCRDNHSIAAVMPRLEAALLKLARGIES